MMINNNYLIPIFIFLRYFILAGIIYLFFYKIFKTKLFNLKIQKKFPKYSDYFREIKHSILTSIIFGIYGILVFKTQFKDYTKIYNNINEHSYLYFLLSVFLAILMHDAYFYFIHRIIHHKKIFRWVHLVHHKSTNPNPFSAYSFHPLEAIIEGAIIILIVITFPIHKYAIFIFLLNMVLFNIYGHLGFELFPKKFINSYFGKFINTATNHNFHHKVGKKNYGLYFTIWDRIFNTLEKNDISTYN